MNTAMIDLPDAEHPAYVPPMVTYEALLEVRAGTPLSIPDLSSFE